METEWKKGRESVIHEVDGLVSEALDLGVENLLIFGSAVYSPRPGDIDVFSFVERDHHPLTSI